MRTVSLRIAAVLTLACLSAHAAAGEFGTVEEARAMLQRAAAAVKADKRAAIEKFNYNAPGFRDRDLFVFCFNASDGIFTAHEAMVTQDVRRLRDAVGASLGERLFTAATDEQITRVSYVWPLPGSTRNATRDAYLLRVGDQVCGVSAYSDDVRAHAQ